MRPLVIICSLGLVLTGCAATGDDAANTLAPFHSGFVSRGDAFLTVDGDTLTTRLVVYGMAAVFAFVLLLIGTMGAKYLVSERAQTRLGMAVFLFGLLSLFVVVPGVSLFMPRRPAVFHTERKVLEVSNQDAIWSTAERRELPFADIAGFTYRVKSEKVRGGEYLYTEVFVIVKPKGERAEALIIGRAEIEGGDLDIGGLLKGDKKLRATADRLGAQATALLSRLTDSKDFGRREPRQP